MKQYIIDYLDSELCLFQFNEEVGHYIKVKSVTEERLFHYLDKLIESKINIEKLHLVNNILEMKVIYFFDGYLYTEEVIKFKISNKLLNNEDFRCKLYHRLNEYNAILKQETLNNIAVKKFNPENVRKRRLMATS